MTTKLLREYSIGSRGYFSYETGILNGISSKCEIHAFDRDDAAFGINSVELGKQAGVQFHHTSLGSATKEVPNGKRFREIGPNLKHEGKTIDVQRHVSYQN